MAPTLESGWLSALALSTAFVFASTLIGCGWFAAALSRALAFAFRSPTGAFALPPLVAVVVQLLLVVGLSVVVLAIPPIRAMLMIVMFLGSRRFLSTYATIASRVSL